MRAILLFLSLALSSWSLSAQTVGLGDRNNVMECSHDEVVAYMDLPDPARRSMTDFHAWKAAYQSSEVKRAESDPTVCIGLLYGDLQAMGDRIKAATASLSSLSLPSMSEVMSSLGDKLSESICSRVQAGADELRSEISDQAQFIRKQAEREVVRRYGQRAMEEYLTDAVVPPELQYYGLEYRNGKIDRDDFRRHVKARWKQELDEMKDDAIDL